MLIQRDLRKTLLSRIRDYKKMVIVYGPRQSGKTTLCREVLSDLHLKTLSVNGDEQLYIDVLSSRDKKKLLSFAQGYDLLFIDEAQRIRDIGINLKILVDHLPELKILVTGSSSLDIAQSVSEPLTGRYWSYRLYPIAVRELQNHFNDFELAQQLDERLIWGSYPEVFHYDSSSDRESYLRHLAGDYLYKDILISGGVRNADNIRRLLKLLAFQVGSEVSLNELGQQLDMSKETVARYIDLLEKSFVLIRLGGFSRNLRKEVTKSYKYYFIDVGVRNSIIDNFNILSDRNDVGALWENFLLVERIKKNAYADNFAHPYFWRTYTGAEIDYIEERKGGLSGFEFKWGRKKPRMPQSWRVQYPSASWSIIDKNNWLDFVR